MAAKRRERAKKESDLEDMVRSGDEATAYEALQLFRSRASRAKQRGDLDGALRVVTQGSKVLLASGYDTAGAELAMLLLELIQESKREFDPETRSMVTDTDDSFSPASSSRLTFLKEVLTWNAANGQRKLGDPMLHSRLALCMWEIGGAHRRLATYHFAAGECPERLSEKLIRDFSDSNPDELLERDRLFTLAVLHYLSIENLRDANELLQAFKKALKARSAGKTEYRSDLLSFSDFLIQCSRRDALPLFKKLCNSYSSALSFDPSVGSLLSGPIGQRLFGLEPPKPDMMSMLQGMFR